MGRGLLVWRLVANDIRHRRAQALLLLLAIAAAATTLTLGLALQNATDNPFVRTQAATNGPDVVATLMPTLTPAGAHAEQPANPQAVMRLENAAGVAAHSGPFPVTWTLLRTGHVTAAAEVQGRGSASSIVDQPKMVNGSWVRSGGIVVEASFADAIGVRVGDRLNLGGDDVKVVGTAVTAAIPDYPQVCAFSCILRATGHSNPGLIWASAADTKDIARAPTSAPVAYYLNLKLTDPTQASTFAHNYTTNASPTFPPVFVYSSQYIRDADTRVIANVQLFLFTGSCLLALLALASVVVLVGSRMADQTRRVGLLKAVGGTPRLIAVVLLCENAAVGLFAAGVGLVIGRLVAPSLDRPGAGLLGVPSTPSVGGSTVALVIASAVAVAIGASFTPAIRAARQSTVTALEDSARAPQRRASVIKLSAHLPAALLLGARIAIRRPGRLLLNLFSIAITVSGLVAVAALHTTEANPGFTTPGDPLKARLREVTTIIAIVLVTLAAVNALFIAWTTVLEARYTSALARALGATPQQVTTGLSVAQALPALIGSLFGIPGGIATYYAFIPHAGTTTLPSVFWFVLIVVVTPIAVGLLTAVPTRIAARRPVAPALTAG